MAKYLEYDATTGRIISEIISSSPPEVSGGYELLEIDSAQSIDTSSHAVREGKLVKLFETAEERNERERLRREKKVQARHRVKSMIFELGVALLAKNEKAIADLQTEYKTLEAYL